MPPSPSPAPENDAQGDAHQAGRKLLRKRGKLAATATLTAKPAIVGAADKVKKAPLKIRVAKKKKQKR